jgi:hypothetical protein
MNNMLWKVKLTALLIREIHTEKYTRKANNMKCPIGQRPHHKKKENPPK